MVDKRKFDEFDKSGGAEKRKLDDDNDDNDGNVENSKKYKENDDDEDDDDDDTNSTDVGPDIFTYFKRLIEGNQNVADILIQMSANEDSVKYFLNVTVFQTLKTLISINNNDNCNDDDNNHNHELWVGSVALIIVGNLTRLPDILEAFIENLDIPASLMANVSSGQPLYIKETYRIFINLMAGGYKHLLMTSPILTRILKSLKIVFNNSLNSDLLAQAAQLLFYVLSNFNMKNAHQYIRNMIMETLNSSDMTELLSASSIQDTTGFEWLMSALELLLTKEYNDNHRNVGGNDNNVDRGNDNNVDRGNDDSSDSSDDDSSDSSDDDSSDSSECKNSQKKHSAASELKGKIHVINNSNENYQCKSGNAIITLNGSNCNIEITNGNNIYTNNGNNSNISVCDGNNKVCINGNNNNIDLTGDNNDLIINGSNNNITLKGDNGKITLNGSNNSVRISGSNNTTHNNGNNNEISLPDTVKRPPVFTKTASNRSNTNDANSSNSRKATTNKIPNSNSDSSTSNHQLSSREKVNMLEKLLSLLTSSLTNDEKFSIILNIDVILTRELNPRGTGNIEDIARALELLTNFAKSNNILIILELMEEAFLHHNKVLIKCCSRIIRIVSALCYTNENVINATWIIASVDALIPNIIALHEQSRRWIPLDEVFNNDNDINNIMAMFLKIVNIKKSL